MTRYKYKNLKGVILHGIAPFSEKVFDHKIDGGGIKLIEQIKDDDKKITKKKQYKDTVQLGD